MAVKRVHSGFLLAIFLLALLPIASAGEVAATGGNITGVGLSISAGGSYWHGACGAASPSPVSTLSISAVPGNISCLTINTGSGSCANGPRLVNLIFSNSSSAITSLSAGSLAALDNFINTPSQNATRTFTSTSVFNTSAYGTLSGVPTAYTAPAAQQAFRTGYLQDSAGNFVFISPVAYNQTGFNGSLFDFQLILPTNQSPATYHVTVDLSCNSASQPPPSPSPSEGRSSTVSPSLGPPLPSPPPVSIPSEPPEASELRVVRLSPFREVFAGDRIILNPLIENPTREDVQVSLKISGAGSELAQPVENVLLSPLESKTVPISVRLPSNLKDGYYSLVLSISSGGSEVSYPTIMHVLPAYKIGQPSIRRHFSLDFGKGETQVTLTVTNTGDRILPFLQVEESVPAALLEKAGESAISAEPDQFDEHAAARVEGGRISWSLENIAPASSRSMVYKIPVLLSDASSYSAWNLASFSSVEPASTSEVLVRDLQAPSLLPGETGEIYMKLFNSGAARRDVELDILGPQAWKISPRSLSTSIGPRDSNPVSISVQPPPEAAAGTYGLTFRMKYRNAIFDRQVFVYVYSPATEIFAPPIADQLSAWLGAHTGLLMVFGFGVILTGVGAYVLYQRVSMPRFSRERVEDLRVLERLYREGGRGKTI